MELTKVPLEESGEEYGAAGAIRARIIDEENGFRLLTGVRVVRVHSRDYTLLIMEDYLPALGKIDGSVTFLTGDGEYRLEGIRGFYKHQHNEFTILLDNRLPAAAGPDTAQGKGE